MLEREGSVLRLRIAEVTVLAQVQFAGCLLCLLGRNQGCCGCRAGQVVEYVVRIGCCDGLEDESRLTAAFGDGFAPGIACPDVVAGTPQEWNGSVFGSSETGAGARPENPVSTTCAFSSGAGAIGSTSASFVHPANASRNVHNMYK